MDNRHFGGPRPLPGCRPSFGDLEFSAAEINELLKQLVKMQDVEGLVSGVNIVNIENHELLQPGNLTLEDLGAARLANMNDVFVPWQGSAYDTRNYLPALLRRKGISISYVTDKGIAVKERAVSDVGIDNANWGIDSNWMRVDELSLNGKLYVSPNGTWVINGVDTGIQALGPKGDNGLTPRLKTIDNKLHYSYDGKEWLDAGGEHIAAWFRWSGNKIQISRDNKTWEDFSGEFADNLFIKGYVATFDKLPADAVQGDIWGVGPVYAADDTEQTNPRYRYYVRNAGGWVDNGAFTSIAAGIVQETGDGENVVMSQKAVTEGIRELATKVGVADILPITSINTWCYVKYKFVSGKTYILKSEKKVAYVCTLKTPSYSESNIIDDIGILEAGIEKSFTALDDTSYLCVYSNSVADIMISENESEINKLKKLIKDNANDINHDRLRYNVSAYLTDGGIFRWDTSQSNRKIYFNGNIAVKYVDTEAGYEFTWDDIKTAASAVGYATNDSDNSVVVGNTGALYFDTESKKIVFGSHILSLEKKYIVLFACYYVGKYTGLLVLDSIEKQHNTNIILDDITNAIAYIADGMSFKWDDKTNKTIYFESSLLVKYTGNSPWYEFYWEDIKSAALTANLTVDDSDNSIVVGNTGSLWFNIESKSIVFSSANTLGSDKKYLPLFVTHWTSYVYGLLVDSETIKLAKQNEVDLAKIKEGIGLNSGSVVYYNEYNEVLEKILQSQRIAPDGVTPSPSNRINTLTLLHFSDLHADSENLARIIDFKNTFADYIDDTIHTGDTAKVYIGTNVFETVSGASSILNVIGNHDAWRSGESFYNATEKESYDYILKNSISNWGVTQPNNAETNGYCYYYKDYSAANIRMIVLDCMHYNTTQDTWFANTLEDARVKGLQVIAAQHYPAWNGIEKLPTPFCDYEKELEGKNGSYNPTYERMNDDAYVKVDNFIANGGIFICWIEGHTHYVMTGTTPSHEGQLQIVVDNAGADDAYNSMSRIRGTKTQDAFNILTFDTQSKLIKIVRLGAQYDRFMRKMDVLCYDYGKKSLIALTR